MRADKPGPPYGSSGRHTRTEVKLALTFTAALALALAGCASGVTGDRLPGCRLTRDTGPGGNYLPDAPLRTDLALEGIAGRPLELSGTVYAADCTTPLAGALVEIWGADGEGNYDDSERMLLRGQTRTGESGHYGFRTVRPAPPGSGPEHLHIRVSHPDWEPLFTRVLFSDDPNLPLDPTALRSYRPLTIDLTERTDPDGMVLVGVFDIVLKAP